jgi:hypothetical protein
MQHVMLDLETLSTQANAAIIAIGACWFDPHGEQFKEEPVSHSAVEKPEYASLFPLCFERTIDIQSCIDAGFAVSGSTLKWWMEQGDEARRYAFSGETGLREALNDFTDFLTMVSCNWPQSGDSPVQRDKVCIWGHGAAFDNVILANAFRQMGYEQPWGYSHDRCNRTFVAEWKERGINPELVRVGTFHNALDDAITQALHMQRINAAVREQTYVAAITPQVMASKVAE